jgi:hypothetical protein
VYLLSGSSGLLVSRETCSKSVSSSVEKHMSPFLGLTTLIAAFVRQAEAWPGPRAGSGSTIKLQHSRTRA